MTPAIRADGLCRRFGRVTVLDGLNLEVPQGSVFALLGANGAGKTTTIKILMNILRPGGGRTEVLGTDSRLLGPQEWTRIGYVSENQELPDWMTASYLFSFLKPFYPNWDDALAEELMRQFSLPADRPLRKFSRGMRMKAALASSLAYHPSLLVLDEPFSGLDPLVRDELIGGILGCAEATTIFISSHDLAEIESFASHVAYLEGGRIGFCEEMASLTSRFREVEVVVGSATELPAGPRWPENQWPETWLRRETSAAMVRFVESQFDAARTTEEVRRLFGDACQLSAKAMSLREIFVTLARGEARGGPAAGRKENGHATVLAHS